MVWLNAWLSLACGAPATQPVAHPSFLPFEPGVAAVGRREKIVALAPQLDAFFQQRLEANGATGLAVGIVVDGELVYGRGFGVIDRESQRAIDLDSVFRIASMSKSFTAMAVLKLRDQGKLSLDAPLVSYLPELRPVALPTRDSPQLTARMLLTHASGLTWDDLWGGVSFGLTEAELAPVLQSGVRFAYAPGVAFEYSNIGYALLGRLVERVSGTPFRDYVTANILQPLGMRSTFWSAEQVPAGRLAAGYWGPNSTRAPTPPSTVFASAGGLYTTMRDYVRYVAYQLSAYPPRDEAEHGPVRRSTLREMHQGQRVALMADPSEPIAKRTASGIDLMTNSAAMGWFDVTTCRERDQLEHFGWEPGYNAAVVLLPQRHFGLVILATSRGLRPEDALAVIRDAGALPPERALSPDPGLLGAQRVVNDLLARWDKAAVDAAFDPQDAHYPWFGRLEKDFADIAREHGRCTPEGGLQASSRSRARWRMRCERGALNLTVDLSPTKPVRVQWLRYERELPPDESLTRGAQSVASAIGGGGETLTGVFAATADSARIKQQLAHAAIDHGSCRVEQGVALQANLRGVFSLACDRGRLELVLDLDAQTHQIAGLSLNQPHEQGDPCWR